MSITIELEPEKEARLATLANERGLSVNGFIAALIEREVGAAPDSTSPPPRRRSILEFEGVGARYATGQDAQEYVNELRAEWDHRP